MIPSPSWFYPLLILKLLLSLIWSCEGEDPQIEGSNKNLNLYTQVTSLKMQAVAVKSAISTYNFFKMFSRDVETEQIIFSGTF